MDRTVGQKLAMVETAVMMRKSAGKPYSEDLHFQSVTLGMEMVVGILNTDDFGFMPDERDYPLLFEPKEKDNNKAP